MYKPHIDGLRAPKVGLSQETLGRVRYLTIITKGEGSGSYP
jgi:hypothetical protein